MEYFGLFAFIILLCYWSYPQKIKRLENKVKKLEKQQKGESEMSKLIAELVGKNCRITSEKGLNFFGKMTFECRVLGCDEEWVKLEAVDPKKKTMVKLMRIEDIDGIELLDEN